MSFTARRVLPTIVLACGLLALPAGGAGAATVGVVGTDLVVTGGSEGNAVTVAMGQNANNYVVTDAAGVTGCTAQTATSATCSVNGVTQVVANLGAGDDSVAMGATSQLPLVANGGDGDDTLRGGAATSDRLDGQAGSDLLDGGYNLIDWDVLLGGDGTDTVDYSARLGSVTVSLGPGSDGQGWEGDSVGADVERVLGGAGDDSLTGNDDINMLVGGAGNDTINGLGGADVIDGGDGDDQLGARDAGVVDSVLCGAGTDGVVADRDDTLDACETIELPAIIEPAVDPVVITATQTTTVNTTSLVQALADALRSLTLDGPATLAGPRATQMALTLTCVEPNGCRGTITITAKVPVESRRARASRRGVRMRNVELGKAKVDVAAGKTKVVKAKVSRRGVTQALKNTKTTATNKGPVKRIKARMTTALEGAGGSKKVTRTPFVVEVAQKRAGRR